MKISNNNLHWVLRVILIKVAGIFRDRLMVGRFPLEEELGFDSLSRSLSCFGKNNLILYGFFISHCKVITFQFVITMIIC